MLKYLTLIAPLLVKAPRKNPVQVLVGFAAMALLVAMGTLAVLIGLWFFLARASWGGPDIAWTIIGLLMLLGALAVYFMVKAPVKEPTDHLPYDIKTDPIGELLPNEILKDPNVATVLKQIDRHPMGAVAAAIAVGTLIGREFLPTASEGKPVVLKTA